MVGWYRILRGRRIYADPRLGCGCLARDVPVGHRRRDRPRIRHRIRAILPDNLADIQEIARKSFVSAFEIFWRPL